MKNLLGLMLLLSQVSLAQNHFYGVLLDAHTQEKIPFGHFNYDANKGFISNDKGDFGEASLPMRWVQMANGDLNSSTTKPVLNEKIAIKNSTSTPPILLLNTSMKLN